MVDGFLNILKPPGMTSHDIISHLRRVYGQKKIGHAGTLDPAASGVLPIALGKATRLLEFITNVDKSYRCEMQLGIETSTGDSTGKIINKQDFIMPSKEQIESVLQSFVGEIMQIPSVYSAIKINGVRAYKLARQEKNVDMPSRKVYINSIELASIYDDKILFDVICSKGTYIRTLCEDIGKKLRIITTMSFLVRTCVGSMFLEDASTIEEISAYPHSNLKSVDYGLNLTRINLHENEARDLSQGKRLKINLQDQLKYINFTANDNLAVYCKDKLVAIAQYRGQILSPRKVLQGAE